MYWKREKNKKWNHFYFSNSPPRTKMGAKISKNTDIHIYVYIKKVWEEENSSFRWHRLGPTYLHSQREITFNKKYVSLKKLSHICPPHTIAFTEFVRPTHAVMWCFFYIYIIPSILQFQNLFWKKKTVHPQELFCSGVYCFPEKNLLNVNCKPATWFCNFNSYLL